MAVADIEAVQVAPQPEPEPLPKLEQLSDPAAEVGANGSVPSAAALEDMTVAELKSELKARGLKVSGKKSELIERLQSGV